MLFKPLHSGTPWFWQLSVHLSHYGETFSLAERFVPLTSFIASAILCQASAKFQTTTFQAFRVAHE